jgi:hypothetical protein
MSYGCQYRLMGMYRRVSGDSRRTIWATNDAEGMMRSAVRSTELHVINASTAAIAGSRGAPPSCYHARDKDVDDRRLPFIHHN